jgi:hypothetical protein
MEETMTLLQTGFGVALFALGTYSGTTTVKIQ